MKFPSFDFFSEKKLVDGLLNSNPFNSTYNFSNLDELEMVV